MRCVSFKVGGGLVSIGVIAVALAACVAGDGTAEAEDDGRQDNAGGANEGGFDAGDSTGSGSLCTSGANDDADGDGFTVVDGDCNDCDPNVNPGAIEVLTAEDSMLGPADENCDGNVDEPLPACDTGMAIGSGDAYDAAAALDLCTLAADGGWGIVEAQYIRANGTPFAPGVQAGLLDSFGPNVMPRKGERLLALSSGHARRAGDADACNDYSCQMTDTGLAPPGFPQDVPGCSGDTEINDDVALSVKLRAPTNATGYSFDFSFYSFEYPEFVCTMFNDQFIALVDPAPTGSVNGNISFDSMTNPVSVNIAFFQVCEGCPLGTAELAGTGFDVWDDAGATGWLVTTAPVTGGEELTVRFTIWDTGDQSWDSTVLVDNFQWTAEPGTEVDTAPVPK